MANESRVFRLPAGMSTQVVANAVEAFLSSAKGMEVQSAETTEGYVVQGRQETAICSCWSLCCLPAVVF